MTRMILNLTAGGLMAILSVFLIIQLFSANPMRVDINTTAHPEARTITVQGEGKVSVVPDLATLNVSVLSEAKTVKQVIADNTAKMNQVIAKMKELGIKEKDMTTSQYNLNPQYYYPENRKPVISGYQLNQTLSLKIRNLDLVDNVIDGATALGANNVYGLNFGLDDDSKAKAEAREKAFAAAKAKAEVMANAAGVSLGRVYTFSEGYDYPRPQPVYYAKTMMAEDTAGSAPDIQTGSQEYTVTINMTYEIE
ncbi:SIMPL domain-containing protein [Candidatus Peregrinibacteria bacterium]|nr:SIMPL domain-containing protein [Candidatus Peregrinibacteria bacterium]